MKRSTRTFKSLWYTSKAALSNMSATAGPATGIRPSALSTRPTAAAKDTNRAYQAQLTNNLLGGAGSSSCPPAIGSSRAGKAAAQIQQCQAHCKQDWHSAAAHGSSSHTDASKLSIAGMSSRLEDIVPNTGRGGEASAKHSSTGGPLPQRAVGQRHCGSVRANFRHSSTKLSTAAGHAARSHLSADAAHFLPRSTQAWRPRTLGRSIATAAIAADFVAEVAAGALVEFRKDQKVGLALIQEPDGKRNWKAVDTRGINYSLRPQQIVYVLPGREYTADDLHSIFQKADQHAADHSLMETAWEVVKEEDHFYTVVQMAELLFGEANPVFCYAAHRLLNQDRTYFKQVGRAPPVFQARPDKEVATVLAHLEAERKAQEEEAACLAALKEAVAKPYGEKPTSSDWLSGPWADRIWAMQEYALLEHDPNFPPEVPSKLMATMQPLTRGSATPQAAAMLLKQLGVWPPHQHLAPLRAGLTESFPPAAMAEAVALAQSPRPDPDACTRQSFLHMTVWAIDSADTTEVDDAVSVERMPDGRHKLWVHIADPTRWLAPGSALDKEAARRTTSLYLPTGSVSMFPRELAEGVFSMQPGKEGCALSVFAVLDNEGTIADCGATCSTVVPQRITYDELEQRLPAANNENDADLHILLEVSRLRQEWRQKQGAVQITLPECEVRVSRPESTYPDVFLHTQNPHKSPARTLVAELMIMANEAIAAIGAGAGLALPYRGQAAIVMPKEEELAAVPEGMCQEVLIRSRMTRSVCTTAGPLHHAGLALPGYVQTTSPIRRYMDLLAHWQLKAHLRGESPPFNAETLNDIVESVHQRTRDCVLVDREVSKYWLAEYFSRQIKEDPFRTYSATMLGWIREESGFAKAILHDCGLEIALRVNRPVMPGASLLLYCALADVSTSEIRWEEAQASTSAASDADQEDEEASREQDTDAEADLESKDTDLLEVEEVLLRV